MGHVRNYVIGDICARYHKLKGDEAIHPMGWMFWFCLENAAIQFEHTQEIGLYPILKIWNLNSKIGFGFRLGQRIATCNEDYYRFQQELFIDLYNHGLAYKKDALVNWDPVDQTVLANEQVIDGKGWRTGAIVEQKILSQWFFKITNYAEELLSGLDNLSLWPEKVKVMQRNWIGKSIGAEIDFEVKKNNQKIKIFTTRPDTIYGATFIALSVNHPLIATFLKNEEISKIKTQFANINHDKEKIGIPLGMNCENPITKEEIPIFIANFVLDNYGEGAIFGCPAHDDRDYEFASKYNLPI